MKTIVEAQKRLAKVISKQKIKDTSYRLMHYVFLQEVEDGLLLHNAITGKMILLNTEEQDWIPEESTEYRTELDELIHDYYLVPTDYNEAKFVEQIRTVLRAMDQNKTITGYTILPTTYCNARCYYCYEANMKHDSMTEETANAVVDFIRKNHGGHKVSLRWFGGEPTIGAERIEQICVRLKETGIEFDSSMISNGFLFDEMLVKKAVEVWNLKNIQISLDGTEEVYNQTKAYLNSTESAFKRVLRNIKRLLQAGVIVIVRINLSFSNADDLNVLVSNLSEEFSDYKNFHLYSHTLFDANGLASVHYQDNEEELLIEKQVEINRKIRDLQLSKGTNSLPYLRFRSCMADSSSSVIINPDGTLAKCEHHLEMLCGDIFVGINAEDHVSFWRNYNALSCTSCKLYPFCLILKDCSGSLFCTSAEKELRIENVYDRMKQKMNLPGD